MESAITIGLYPDLPRDISIPVGNGSLKGARMLLRNAERLSTAEISGGAK
ncbi:MULTISPECIES: ASKHA domain-containing protein [unclassified Dehalobacter]|nr:MULTISPECIES: ASKHA domain-containing protein [unclassified Dehalobacter]